MRKLINKAISTALSVCLFASTIPALANNETQKHPFTDVSETQWYNGDVQNVWEKGIINGITDTEFQPQTTLTRAMVVTILGRLANIETENYTQSKFTDVDVNKWYAPFVIWAAEKGIATGITETEFAPDMPVTREQFATFIQRYIDKKGLAARCENSLGYKDADAVSAYARIAVSACKNIGVMQGDSEGNFAPSNNTTRAEAAAVITRLEKYIADYTFPVFNEFDNKKIVTAMQAMNKADCEGAELVKWIYQIAFTKSATLNGTPEEIINNILGETSDDTVSMLVPGMSSKTPDEEFSAEDFLTGDVLLIKIDSATRMYMFDGDNFVEMVKDYVYKDKLPANEAVAKTKEAELYAVLRPSRVMTTVLNSNPDTKLALSETQEALITTAESYIRRGDRIQYDAANMSPYGEYRSQQGLLKPEVYSDANIRYTNCAALCRDIYLFTLDYQIGMTTTRALINGEDSVKPFYYIPTGNETDAQRAEIEEKFLQELQPADIIVYRYNNDKAGHALFYAGNGNMIHSTGTSYSYKNLKEVYEATVRYKQVRDLFVPTDNRYIFGGLVNALAIVRPLNKWSGTVPEIGANRVKNMSGIVAEKLSSHNGCKTVNPGDEMTFTFYVFNTNDYEVNVDVTDVVPANTTYVSGAQNVQGDKLSWILTVGAGEYKEATYTVKVNSDKELTNGAYISSEEGKVGGLSVPCQAVYIANTLTKEEQDKISKAANELKDSDITDFDKVNAIYKNAMGVENILPGTSYEDIPEGVFVIDTEWDDGTGLYYQLGRYKLREDGIYPKMVVPSCYGGRSVVIEPYGKRTRLLKEEHLIVGDILLARNINEKNLFIYTNEGLLDLNKGTIVEDAKTYMESLQGLDNFDYYYFVLRPSMIIE